MKRINRQIELIHSLINELETEKSYRGIERLIQLIIQTLLDLGLMVISTLKSREPKSYSEIGYFIIGIISESNAKLMKSMPGLRNILVHAYATIDREKYLNSLKS